MDVPETLKAAGDCLTSFNCRNEATFDIPRTYLDMGHDRQATAFFFACLLIMALNTNANHPFDTSLLLLLPICQSGVATDPADVDPWSENLED